MIELVEYLDNQIFFYIFFSHLFGKLLKGLNKREENMSDSFDYSVVDSALEKCGEKESSIIAVLQLIQEHYHYLPEEIFPYLAKKLKMSEARIFSVATFYENFSLEKKGKYVIKFCDGTACHVRGSIPILERVRSELGVSEKKKTTEDQLFTIETVSCLGACGLAPVMTLNDEVHPAMTPDKAMEIIYSLKVKEGSR